MQPAMRGCIYMMQNYLNSCILQCLWGGGLVYKVEEVLKEDAAVLAQSYLTGAAGGVAFRATLNLIT